VGLPVDDLTSTLCQHISQTTFEDLGQDVVDAATRSLLDGIGVMLAASGIGDGCDAFAELVLSDAGAGRSTVLGYRARVPAANAALANGAFSHAVDFEDAFDTAPSHPNAQVLPAVLAIAEDLDVSGQALVTAVAVGCDITCRLGLAAWPAINDRGWYAPPLFGAIGATAACANLLKLDARQTADALSLVIMQNAASGEIKSNPESTIRAIRDSFPAQAAVRSAQLAARGIRGFDLPLEGTRGFFATFAGNDFDRDALTGGLGRDFAGPRVSFKPWPSCRSTHAYIEAALALRPDVPHGDIVRIELDGAPVNLMLAEPKETKRAPQTAIDAKFSMMFTVAAALVRGKVDLDTFTTAGLADAEILRVAGVTDFIPDPQLIAPSDMTVGTVRIFTRDGSVVSHSVTSPKGSPSSPMPTVDLVEKFAACAAKSRHPRSEEEVRESAHSLLSIASLAGVRDLIGSL